ncbi:hypothetical protein F2P56_029101 [Juglans regia]|uniref:Uncharacterized protein n=2 Tax=Juglans regia TaxID=51240 RepID=A0A833WW86_JUGRE|nr:uncharacterized protein LOC109007054 [Juglans regia]KAF5448582.1 hypothetical protein F2P56_029101 [Juglans regia]
MDRSEPALVPEWLKSSGSVTGGGGTNHQFSSSSLHSDDHAISKHARNVSSMSECDHDPGHLVASDQATSFNFHGISSGNSSVHTRSYSSYGRSYRDRDWEDIVDYRDQDKLVFGDHGQHDYSDPLDSILPNRFEKDVLQCSESMSTGNHGDTWPRKVAACSNNAKSKHRSSDRLLGVSSVVSSSTKSAFERDFPSLVAEERQHGSDMGRISSSSLNTVIQSLPIGNLSVTGCDGWKSALAEVPVIAGSNCTGAVLAQQTIFESSASLSPRAGTGLNMAETLAQGTPRTPSHLSIGTQRLEEMAVKQSRQLIPMTPSTPKALVSSPSEKSKPNIGQQHTFSSHPVNKTPRGGYAKSDVTKIPVGNLRILNPSRESKGISSTPKDGLSPTVGSRVANSPFGLTPSAAASAPPRNLSNNLSLASAECRPTACRTTVDKKTLSQAQSRNDFFKNLSRKNSSANHSSVIPDPGPAISIPENSDKLVTEASTADPVTLRSRDAPLSDTSKSWGQTTPNGCACDVSQKCLGNAEEYSRPSMILHPDEEEAAFLRSLGWEENAGEDEGLTEEEISAFYMEYMKLRPSSKLMHEMQPNISPALNSQQSSCSCASSELVVSAGSES